MTKSTHILLVAAAVFVLVVAVDAFRPLAGGKQQQDADAALSEFMRQKLEASNQILEGLVTEDFDLVGKGAEKLQEISSSEQWRISNDALYRQYSGEFQRIAKRLEQTAKDKKLEAATLTWIETTMGCIECHKYARSILIAAEPTTSGAGF